MAAFLNPPKKLSQSVLLLSEIMQFTLKETGADGKVFLSEEMDRISNFSEINRYRFSSALNLNVEYKVSHVKLQDYPLNPFFTLTENLFKHGNLADPLHPAALAGR